MGFLRGLCHRNSTAGGGGNGAWVGDGRGLANRLDLFSPPERLEAESLKVVVARMKRGFEVISPLCPPYRPRIGPKGWEGSAWVMTVHSGLRDHRLMMARRVSWSNVADVWRPEESHHLSSDIAFTQPFYWESLGVLYCLLSLHYWKSHVVLGRVRSWGGEATTANTKRRQGFNRNDLGVFVLLREILCPCSVQQLARMVSPEHSASSSTTRSGSPYSLRHDVRSVPRPREICTILPQLWFHVWSRRGPRRGSSAA